MATKGDHFLRRDPQRPRRADAGSRSGATPGSSWCSPTCATRPSPSASASSSRSTRLRRCSSAEPAPWATSTSSGASWSAASTAEGLRWLAERGGRRRHRVRVGLPDGRRATSRRSSRPRRCSRAARLRSRSLRPTTADEPPRRSAGSVSSPPPGDDAALETARGLAESLGARVTRDEPLRRPAGRRLAARGAATGRVMITSQAQNAIENATCPVLVVPRGAWQCASRSRSPRLAATGLSSAGRAPSGARGRRSRAALALRRCPATGSGLRSRSSCSCSRAW